MREFKSVEEKVMYYLEKIGREDRKVRAFLSLNEGVVEDARELDKKPKSKRGKLFGWVFGIKSNINVGGQVISCASKTLENYKAGYDATVIKKIKEEDGLIIGMLNMDEFASGSSGETSAFAVCQNPRAKGRVPGGSSSGSAAAVASGFCDVSLGSDTGGSIRNPASHCGVVGVKPSYGKVSRYGLIDLSMSLDQIGPLGKTVKDVSRVLEIISGKDDKDTISEDFEEGKKVSGDKVKVGVIRLKSVDPLIQSVIDLGLQKVEEKLKWSVEDIEVEYIDLAVQTYYPLVYVEFFSGTRRFDGRRFGKKIEDKAGSEVLRRIEGGREITKAEFEGRYYNKALEVKNLISGEFDKAFKKVDCIISPVVPKLPWVLGKTKEMKVEDIYAADALTIPANLAGLCALSLPAGVVEESGAQIPVGMQIMCAKGQDNKMLDIAEKVEGVLK